MKHINAAYILQTLVFMQKEDCDLSKTAILETNPRELHHCNQTRERTRTRYQIVSEDEQECSSIIVRVQSSTMTRPMYPNISTNTQEDSP